MINNTAPALLLTQVGAARPSGGTPLEECGVPSTNTLGVSVTMIVGVVEGVVVVVVMIMVAVVIVIVMMMVVVKVMKIAVGVGLLMMMMLIVVMIIYPLVMYYVFLYYISCDHSLCILKEEWGAEGGRGK